MSGLRGVGGDAHNVQLPMPQRALRPKRLAAPTEPSGDCPSGGSCAIYIGMSSIRSIHSIRRTKSLRKSLATNFFGPFPQEIARHKTFSANCLRKSPATKLFQLISSGNRPPQNFFSSFPQETGSSLTHSFPQAIVSDRIAHAELALTMKGAGTIKGAKNGASRPKRI